ncbi:hypothetical protein [Paenibacillus rhizoplanae]|uniref:hypothetical protein n=1 Tax=Paenibacillus rhizoplanae TaxID=1917181 RepID=UPI00360FC1F1
MNDRHKGVRELMDKRKVTILCSGFGLGFYIPGLLAASGFKKRDIATEVLVFESYLEQDKRDHIADSRKAYHNNFALANFGSNADGYSEQP